MALPFSFTAVTAATGADLDDNFAAVGALAAISCSLSGTNAVTATPFTNAPTVSAYTNNALFSGVVASTNTAAVTFRVGTLPPLPVYKDSISGPVALSGGEQTAGNLAMWAYDGTLNSGTGGFHLFNPLAQAVYPPVGSARNLFGTSAGGGVTASWTADELVAKTSLGGAAALGVSLSLSFNGAGTGANGMDTGAVPTSAQLAVYAIYNPGASTWATLGYSAGGSAAPQIYPGANMPSGYRFSCLLWVGVTDGSAHIQAFVQKGRSINVGPTQVLSMIAAASNTYYSLSVATVVPAGADTAWGILAGTSTTQDLQLALAANSSGSYVQYAVSSKSSTTLDGLASAKSFDETPFITPQTFYWKSGNTMQTNVIQVSGYTF